MKVYAKIGPTPPTQKLPLSAIHVPPHRERALSPSASSSIASCKASKVLPRDGPPLRISLASSCLYVDNFIECFCFREGTDFPSTCPAIFSTCKGCVSLLPSEISKPLHSCSSPVWAPVTLLSDQGAVVSFGTAFRGTYSD